MAGKPRNIKSDQAALTTLVMHLANVVLNLEQDPQIRVQLLSAMRSVDGGSTDTGWVSSASEASSEETNDGT